MAGKGRKKLENKLIESASARMVCFSKRRKGLFKKAEELSVLCGTKVAVLAFSQAGKLYCSDFETFDTLLCPQTQLEADSFLCPPPAVAAEKEAEICWEFDFNEAMAGNSLPFWYNKPNVQCMDCEELRRLESAILEYGHLQLGRNSCL
ncbi:MADS-box transcription factor 23-like [Phalaenopsis equestris]|uniref:MADS-box transcription factor 23-like n=1 Tax=Phalaenopsis equestris TaxID=78828 RepID=UPI0009E22535|nr:MADS-box transcription factor 23-like [Phalaenopsis equestris]